MPNRVRIASSNRSLNEVISFYGLSMLVSSLQDPHMLRANARILKQYPDLAVLETINLTYLHSLIHTSNSIELHCDLAKLNEGIQKMIQLKNIDEQMSWCIREGAPNQLLEKLFTSVDPEKFKDLRRGLLPEDKQKRGRKLLPPDAVRDEIHEIWHKLKKNIDQNNLQKIQALKTAFPGIDLGSLYSVIAEFDEAFE